MKIQKKIIPSHGERLSAAIALPDGDMKAALVRISGGHISPHSPNHWQEPLADRGIASVTFDFSGIGESTGKLEDTNLLIRLKNTESVIDYFKDIVGQDVPLIILGVSMGAPLAIWLAQKQAFAGLALAVPAAYPKDSHDKNFGSAFTDIIRIDESWRDSVEFDGLRSLSLPILLATARDDEVIPPEIIQTYKQIIADKDQVAEEFDAPHPFLRAAAEFEGERARFWTLLGDFILSK